MTVAEIESRIQKAYNEDVSMANLLIDGQSNPTWGPSVEQRLVQAAQNSANLAYQDLMNDAISLGKSQQQGNAEQSLQNALDWNQKQAVGMGGYTPSTTNWAGYASNVTYVSGIWGGLPYPSPESQKPAKPELKLTPIQRGKRIIDLE